VPIQKSNRIYKISENDNDNTFLEAVAFFGEVELVQNQCQNGRASAYLLRPAGSLSNIFEENRLQF
jgi:hypothetical protein